MKKILFLFTSFAAIPLFAQDVPVALLPMNPNNSLNPEKAQAAAPVTPIAPILPAPAANAVNAAQPWAGYAAVQATAENGNPQEALAQLNRRLAIEPDDSRAAYLKGLVLMQLGQSEMAERWFKMMQANFPDLPQVNNALAVIYSGRGDLPAAEAVLRELLSAHPDHNSARVNLAKLYLQLAQGELEKALKNDPDNAMIARDLQAIKSL